MATRIANQKTFLLTWLLIPILLAYISVSYLLGVIRENQPAPVVVSATQASDQLVSSMLPKSPSIKPLVWDGEPLVTFWFDDAWLSQFTEGYRILEKYGYKGALAVPTRLVESGDYMTWTQIRQVEHKGWEITSHTRIHSCDNKKYRDDTFVQGELVGSLEDFSLHGIKPAHFVTPCGINEPKIHSTARTAYKSLRGTGEGVNPLPVPEEYLYDLRVKAVRNTTTITDVEEWIAEAKATNSWLIIMFHQIDHNKAEYIATPQMAEEIVKAVKASELQVVVPSEVIGMEIEGENETE